VVAVRHPPDKAEPPAAAAAEGSRSGAAERQIALSIAPPGASECRGCGVLAELVQNSDYCWDCTYDPPCLCFGRPGIADDPGGLSYGRRA